MHAAKNPAVQFGWYHPSEVPARPRTSIHIWTLVPYCSKQMHGPESEVIGSLPTAMLHRQFRRESKNRNCSLRLIIFTFVEFEITLRLQNVKLIWSLKKRTWWECAGSTALYSSRAEPLHIVSLTAGPHSWHGVITRLTRLQTQSLFFQCDLPRIDLQSSDSKVSLEATHE